MSKKTLHVAVIGPKGQCGSCVVDELLSRGHKVTGISRSPPKTWRTPGDYTPLAAEIHDEKGFAKALSGGYDAIVCAYGPPLHPMNETYYKCVEDHVFIKKAVFASTHKGVFLIIGGAGSLHCKNGTQLVDQHEFPYSYWYVWPDKHLEYMRVRAADHGDTGFSRFIGLFRWARNNVTRPGWFSWMFRPFARMFLRSFKKTINGAGISLIGGSRAALSMWEGVTERKWTFLSPPWFLRDKGVRTGEYEAFVDEPGKPAHEGVDGGIYNEDMAVAIVDECENDQFAYKHWTCTGPIDVKGHRW